MIDVNTKYEEMIKNTVKAVNVMADNLKDKYVIVNGNHIGIFKKAKFTKTRMLWKIRLFYPEIRTAYFDVACNRVEEFKGL